LADTSRRVAPSLRLLSVISSIREAAFWTVAGVAIGGGSALDGVAVLDGVGDGVGDGSKVAVGGGAAVGVGGGLMDAGGVAVGVVVGVGSGAPVACGVGVGEGEVGDGGGVGAVVRDPTAISTRLPSTRRSEISDSGPVRSMTTRSSGGVRSAW
jgi:hypothetical protein